MQKQLGKVPIVLISLILITLPFYVITSVKATNITLGVDIVAQEPRIPFINVYGIVYYPNGGQQIIDWRYLGGKYYNIPVGSTVHLIAVPYNSYTGQYFDYWIIYMLINNQWRAISSDYNPLDFTLNYNTIIVAVYN